MRLLSNTNLVKLIITFISIGLWCINFFHVYKDFDFEFRIAKGFGLNLRVWIMFLYFTMCRSILNGKIEKHTVYHKFIGYIVMISSIGHTVSHLVYNRKLDLEYITGYILFSVFMLIVLGYISRYINYSLFKYTHMLYYLVLPLCIIHVTNLWVWFVIPVIIYSIELILNLHKLQFSAIRNIDRQGDHMFISIPRVLDSIPGSYYYLCVPILGIFEWHPFSVCSSSHINHLTFMIEVNGDWTKALYNVLGNHDEDINLFIMGPFRTSSNLIMNVDIKKKVVICTGVGITPFLSVINTKIDEFYMNNKYRNDYSDIFQYNIQQHRAFKLNDQITDEVITYRNSSLDLHWTFRDIEKVKNFFNYIRKIIERSNNINVYIYITKKMSDVEKLNFIDKYKSFGIKSITFGRINFETINASKVYFCGSSVLRESLKLHCNKMNIEFYSEVF